MHINEAKTQIRNAITAYCAKNANGTLKIPVQAQRPVFLVGAPGIGKPRSLNRSLQRWISALSPIQ